MEYSNREQKLQFANNQLKKRVHQYEADAEEIRKLLRLLNKQDLTWTEETDNLFIKMYTCHISD